MMNLLQLTTSDGTVLRFHSGEKVEMDLRAEVAAAIFKRGHGTAKRRLLTMTDINSGIEDALESFKAKSTPWTVKV